jgi:hypothetical protein
MAQACNPIYSREQDKDHGRRPPLAKFLETTLMDSFVSQLIPAVQQVRGVTGIRFQLGKFTVHKVKF